MTARQRSTLILIVAFWAFTFAMLSIRAAFVESLPFSVIGPRRAITAAFGVALCLAMVWLLARLRTGAFFRWIAWGVGGALVMAVALTSFGFTMNRVVAPLPGLSAVTPGDYAQWVLIWLGYCLAWTGTHLALTYHWDVQDEQARSARMTALASEARFAALRYQINPHFLFNTLNSISALVLERRNDEAERMLLNLSAFVRTLFAHDPGSMIPLREEFAFQRLYLQIEQARFEARLTVVFDFAEGIGDMPVPTLILQPLVENAIRHGVGAAEQPTTIRICAARSGEWVELMVEDDAIPVEPSAPGTGLGLTNTRERLAAHYGSAAILDAAPRTPSGYCALIRIPAAAA
ncbi:sensor histidine kinase [Sphingomonas sp. LT1P40]|uniref:sensor histidine kinase n=1 Tax=Alteristakelama amylovorans TaxID=3096166 RepID=UPI002FC8DE23